VTLWARFRRVDVEKEGAPIAVMPGAQTSD
jgi:hypothetical protein